MRFTDPLEQKVQQAQEEVSRVKIAYEEQIAALKQQNQTLHAVCLFLHIGLIRQAMLAWKAKSQAVEAQNKTLKEKIQSQSIESAKLTELCEQLISKLEGM